MLLKILAALSFGIILQGSVDAPGGQAAPSFPAVNSYCAPTFVIDRVPRAEGTGFLLERLGVKRQTYLLTAQHLFSFSWADMPAHVTGARCLVVPNGRTHLAGAAIAIEGAHPIGPPAELKDIAAFPIEGVSPGLSLAQRNVALGQAVWLLARVKGGRETGMLLHRAVVQHASGFLFYRFDDQTINLDQTSGGAVLNQDGEVVGLNVGYVRLGDGMLVGVANGLATLKDVVSKLP